MAVSTLPNMKLPLLQVGVSNDNHFLGSNISQSLALNLDVLWRAWIASHFLDSSILILTLSGVLLYRMVEFGVLFINFRHIQWSFILITLCGLILLALDFLNKYILFV
ncbi:hypothetical protein SAMN05444392_11843 [Seinonella peptonophila]|uniref:Uncharacterized protein n=1 Tax=Seinonella peptonophila TaxID=112248 RepID=A0A1M5B5P1_9BACL|nr:hypothetical protein SAMN05444392_11843 [Seinonella peptonophila]